MYKLTINEIFYNTLILVACRWDSSLSFLKPGLITLIWKLKFVYYVLDSFLRPKAVTINHFECIEHAFRSKGINDINGPLY